ncbi:MAG: N-acetylglucosamine-6-phosphate deacetylase [Luteitalea sp.]|nr:N-acetylglucosamine-6-phosphate deacetylase [Luteitalea sp.]
MIVLSGAELVLPDRILSAGTLVVDEGRIVEIRSGAAPGTAPATSPFAFHDHYILPGFIDVHVHGVEGFDTLGPGDAIAEIAARLPRYGVTSFCPTTMACGPAALRRALEQVRRARESPRARAARVLPAHLESNFISPHFLGAQPVGCLRNPGESLAGLATVHEPAAAFTGADILCEISRAAPDVGIVTVAPELQGGLELVAWLRAGGHRVSLGHSGATYEEGLAAIAAGARHATHLFNRMPQLHHRAPGLAGAILQNEDVAAEIICDGVHVHPALVRIALAAKGASGLLAITDGTAAAGLAVGARAMLGEQEIIVGENAAFLPDGRLAGSTVTMSGAFKILVDRMGLSLVDAAAMCATTPARELRLVGHGILARDAVADLVVLDPQLSVVQTYVGGRLAYARMN